MVLICNGNLLNLKKSNKLNCKRNEIFNTLVIDNNKLLKINDYTVPSINHNNINTDINIDKYIKDIKDINDIAHKKN